MSSDAARVVVIGGGLAGMSAAAALTAAGCDVTLVEKRPSLGGRAGSHPDAGAGGPIDTGQHVLMPCCTNLLDFLRRIGAERRVRFYREIPFLGPRGAVTRLRASLLPAPLHFLPSFLALPFLDLGDKAAIARALAAVCRQYRRRTLPPLPFADWLRSQRQTRRAAEYFWRPIVASALNEQIERAATAYAAKFFVEAFLANSRAWWLGVPTAPLSSLYDTDSRGRIAREILLRTEVRQLRLRDGRVAEAEAAGGRVLAAGTFVLALPWHTAGALLPDHAASLAGLERARDLEPSPITGIHLWYDRPVTDLDFAVLPGGSVHWFFDKTRTSGAKSSPDCYLQLVASASRSWSQLGRKEILEIALRELGAALPESARAKLVRARVLRAPAATFSPNATCDALRPPPATAVPNLFLAGDWVRTGWPATMESAVRGGYLAAEAVTAAHGRAQRFLVPDLPPSGLMRFRGMSP